MPKPTTGPGRSARTGRPTATRPLGTRPQQVPSTAKSPARLKLEKLSAGPLVLMHRLPRLAVPAILCLLFLGGLFFHGILSGVLLAVVAVFVGWLVAVSWPLLNVGARILRVAVVVVLFAAALWRLTGHG